MIPVILMILATAASVIFLAESGKAGRMAAAEIVLSKAWSYRFERQRLTETMEEFLAKNEKYHTVSDKKAGKNGKNRSTGMKNRKRNTCPERNLPLWI